MAKYLITGGAGFIGSNLAEELVRQNEKVRILDDFSTGKKENLSGMLDKIELVEGDIRNLTEAKKATKGADFVVHLAAISSVKRSMDDPEGTNKVNIDGTMNVLKAAEEANIKKIVFASSCAVYGHANADKISEKTSPSPLSPYGKAKLKGEVLCRDFSSNHGLPTISLRLFNVFGPRQDPEGEYSAVIPKFITLMLKGKNPTIFGDGKQSRDFVYIRNVVRAITSACRSKIENGDVFNIASGKSYNLIEIVRHLNRLMKTDLEPKYLPERPGEIKHSGADIDKAKNLIAFEPSFTFEEGIKETIKYFKNRRPC